MNRQVGSLLLLGISAAVLLGIIFLTFPSVGTTPENILTSPPQPNGVVSLLTAKEEILAGEILSTEKLVEVFWGPGEVPNGSIHASDRDDIIGLVAREKLAAGNPLRWDQITTQQ